MTQPATILDILKETNQSTSSNGSDINREEMPWTNDGEIYLRDWISEINDKSKHHDIKYRYYKKMYNVLSLPTIIVPILLSPLTSYISEYPLVTSLALIFNGVLSGICSFFNYSKKAQSNDNYSNLYGQLSREISSELRLPSRFRTSSDKFTERIYQKYCALDSSSPK